MQDMSCLISEPANSPPRVLRSDTALERSAAETKESKFKTMPKITKTHQKETQIPRRQNIAVVENAPVNIEPPCVNRNKISASGDETEKNLDTHEEVFRCKDCDKEYNSSASLEKHSSTHTNNERSSPHCKMCDISFTTNSGLHRHMRSHKQTSSHGSDTDSDASSSSPKVNHDPPRGTRKRRAEYNNNGSTDTSIEEDQSPTTRKKSKTINNNCINDVKLSCPVCNKKDFTSPIVFEMHMDEKHPDYQSKLHHIEKKLSVPKKIASVSGFDDCTFIDFSSQKFPEIAKTVCEQSVHKSITEQKFRCKACSRDFPCESALEIHEKCCDVNHLEESTSKSWHEQSSTTSNEDTRRDDFFAKLDLQNSSPNSSENKRPALEHVKPKMQPNYYNSMPKDLRRHFIDSSKDLADISSILSVASSGSLLEQLTQTSKDHHASKEHDQEEVQDAFAAEFRKMKLRGEFPCRLCTAVFPNLRALKGHNRVHLSGNAAGPYRCNMCPHSSLDKAALVRHMRTHNGDRPYECAVCNYAFTTKANCERHLRNRHSKITREDVKRSIIYHPSEDPNNDEMNNKLNISREEIKRTQIFNNNMDTTEHMDDIDRIKSERTTPVLYPRDPPTSFQEHGLNIPIPRDLSIVIPQPRDIIRAHCSTETPIPATSDDVSTSRIKVKGFGQLTQIPEFSPESDRDRENYSDEEATGPTEESFCEKNSNYACETPMDLSTPQDDVLDLSKKKSDKVEEKQAYEPEPDEYSSKALEFNNNRAINASLYEKHLSLLRQQIFKNASIDPTAGFYANPLSQFYARPGAPFTGLGLSPAFPLNPYFLQNNPFLAPVVNPNLMEMNELMQKEIIRGLQLSGGGLVGMDHNNILGNMALANERLQNLQQHAINDLKLHNPASMVKCEDDVKPQPLHVNTDTPTTIPFAPMVSSPAMSSPKLPKKETISTQSPNSVKMVIKNGVLMPKQKQRRYRTERPFSCEHCSARFTLRSNMERHIKQQHPQYWSQRQRSAIGNLPRKNPVSLVPQNITVPTLGFENRLAYLKNVHSEPANVQDVEKSSTQNNQAMPPANKNYPTISDQVKFAILAQQLKSQASALQNDAKNKDTVVNGDNEDEDMEDTLIIDEGRMDDKNNSSKSKSGSESSETDPNLAAKKVAQEILTDASAKQDFDWKITGNLISKNPQHLTGAPASDIPMFVTQIGQSDQAKNTPAKTEEGDLVPVAKLLDNAASQVPFENYFKGDFSGSTDSSRKDLTQLGEGSEEDEEGLVASSGSTSEGNNSGSDENRSDSEKTAQAPQKKKSAYSLAPNRVSCPYCHRKFPWSSSLRRHVLTHTGQKPYKCPHCPLLFTTKSNCDRHLLRKHGSNSQQTLQVSSGTTPPDAIPIPELNNQGFMMRNVPERPFKCSTCASSTFSTMSNLRKHMMCKHGKHSDDSLPGSPKNADEPHSRRESCDNEQPLTSDDERSPKHGEDGDKNDWDNQILTSKSSPAHVQDIPSNMQNSDLPFKCHLCEGSYAERQVALDHIKECHESEYELLVSKGALETGMTFTEDLGSSASGHRSEGGEDQGGEENIEHMRGKFPDYANRKVVCAFCIRRFWSAEDLRRHMRTHTGERPFSCDVCRRRFTLKHSMLRHRKKHSTSDNKSCEDMASGDEDAPSPSTSNYNHSSTMNSINSNRTLSPIPNNHLSHANTSTPISGAPRLTLLNAYQIAINAKNLTTSPEIPNNVNNNNSPPAQTYDGKVKITNTRRELNPRTRYSSEDTDAHESEVESGGDLIGNLLGISDRGMINKLLSSADEAAKLLGVNK